MLYILDLVFKVNGYFGILVITYNNYNLVYYVF